MSTRPPPQLLLPFRSQLPDSALPPPVRRSCAELLSQLLIQVLKAELQEESNDEREDPIQTS